MSETIKIVLMIFFMIGVIFIASYIKGWKIKKACEFIIRDLREKKAFDPASAIELPYTMNKTFNFGLRDYRPRALEDLIKMDIVRFLEGQRYYLREGHKLNGID